MHSSLLVQQEDIGCCIECPTIPAAPVVHIKDGEVFANSRDVADFFGKRHADVVYAIEQIRGYAEFSVHPWFKPVIDINEQNKVAYRSFDMTKDGFTLLVMGYTGQKAMQFKLRYIQRFNEMEQALKQQAQAPALPQLSHQT